MHHMAFRFLGGAHCGRPWHRFGVAYALQDCADHEPNGCAAVLENVLYGEPARCHDTTGWPEFTDWPDPQSLTHEQSYYKWIERSWRSGLRVFVNLMVQNRALCEIYPIKDKNPTATTRRPSRSSSTRPIACRTTSTRSRAGPARASTGSSPTRSRPAR